MNAAPRILVDVFAKFFSYIRIEGWCASNLSTDYPEDVLQKVEFIGLDDCSFQYKVNCPSPSIGRALYKSSGIEDYFKSLLKASDKIIDIGGRDRSRNDQSKYFEQEVTVFDIAEGDNVDIIGDAHELSMHFPRSQFDAAMSVFVFEHLAMPWRVILEINKILKMGGIVFVSTHQTVGLHDTQWDFLRFSEDC
jgi:SAM-dependent methyltransferase